MRLMVTLLMKMLLLLMASIGADPRPAELNEAHLQSGKIECGSILGAVNHRTS